MSADKISDDRYFLTIADFNTREMNTASFVFFLKSSRDTTQEVQSSVLMRKNFPASVELAILTSYFLASFFGPQSETQNKITFLS